MTVWRTSSSSITAPLDQLGCGHDLLVVFWHNVRILWRKINRGEYKSTQQAPPHPTGGEMTCTTHIEHNALAMQLMVCNPFPTQPTVGSSLIVRTTPQPAHTVGTDHSNGLYTLQRSYTVPTRSAARTDNRHSRHPAVVTPHPGRTNPRALTPMVYTHKPSPRPSG